MGTGWKGGRGKHLKQWICYINTQMHTNIYVYGIENCDFLLVFECYRFSLTYYKL